MNYYELHVGDYDKATAHLTACEDGIYGRLLRRYYDTELPLPLDPKALKRLVRARTDEEQEAVDTILSEFFTQRADGWHHKRCDDEIARYRDKRKKAQRSASARWEKARADANACESQCDGDAHQTPITNRQSPVTNHQAVDSQTEESAHVAIGMDNAGSVASQLRQAGFTDVTSAIGELQMAVALGITGDELVSVAKEGARKGKRLAGRWSINTAIGRMQSGEPIVQGGAMHTGMRANRQQELEKRNQAMASAWTSMPPSAQEEVHAAN